MKILGEKRGLERLRRIKDDFRRAVAVYEQKAKSCATCETKGACCLDAHFVNVRISRLEAAAIADVLGRLPDERRAEVFVRADHAVDRFGLSAGEDMTYACPLYDRDAGCLVHSEAKPLPCIHHACYEVPAEMPPDDLLDEFELRVDDLNRRVYRAAAPPVPIPVAIKKAARKPPNTE